MPRVTALCRYPIKGFTPEPREELSVQSDGRISGDRVLAFRFADAAEPESRDGLDYWPKAKGLALMTMPGLARLRLEYDEMRRRVRIVYDGELLVEAGLDEAGRELLTERVAQYVLTTEDAGRLRRRGALPLRLVGDGVTSRFQDRPRGFVSLHGDESLRLLRERLPQGADHRRFRSNIVVSGFAPWEEIRWTGRVRIGQVAFTVAEPIGRCLATHANPDTGERDADVMGTLVTEFGHEDPTFGTLLLPADGGGTIRVGDEVRIG